MKYQNIVVLTGAGISAESGIKTFRASDGLWEEHRVEDVATFEGYTSNPNLVQRFYNERRRTLHSPEIKPNSAHFALVEMEKKICSKSKLKDDGQGQFLLVTQNIDNLHERAGSENIIHMHGELLKVRCMKSEKIFDWKEDLSTDTICECCQKPSNLRPHIVWFGEMPLEMERIEAALAECDLFVSIGTSGHVYPAAGFVEIAKQYQAHTIELNLDPSEKSDVFDLSTFGYAGEIVPEFFNSIS